MPTDFEELFALIKQSPSRRIPKAKIHEIVSETEELTPLEKQELASKRPIHSTVFFEEVIRAKLLTLNEVVAIASYSAPGSVAVIKNIKVYAPELSTEEGFIQLRALLRPVPRASDALTVPRSKKEIVTSLCTREGFFAFAREASEDVRVHYENIYGETFEDTAVAYTISVYAQELNLSDNDKSVVLFRVANALRRYGVESKPAKELDRFIHDRFYHRIFESQ